MTPFVEALTDLTLIFGTVIALVFVAVRTFFRSPRPNNYNTDMREHYNKHYSKQLVKQSGLKNIPKHNTVVWQIGYDELPSTAHWECGGW